MLRFTAAIVACALVVGSVAPARAAQPLPLGDQSQVLALLEKSCDQVVPTAAPSTDPAASAGSVPETSPAPSASPTVAPTPPPLPLPPHGPEQLLPPPLPTSSAAVTPPPLPSPSARATASSGPVFIQRSTPEPRTSSSPSAASSTLPAPEPSETLGPHQYVVLADDVKGVNAPGEPADLDGNVNVIYADGIVIGDHAHYDGTRFIDLTGRPFIRNRADDTVLRADSIRFDTITQKAVLINGRGETTQGVETGHLYYKAKSLTTTGDGRTHGERASFTTCERQRAGYHIEAKTLDILPGDKAILRSAVLFLGGFAVFFLPVVVIPLTHIDEPSKRAGGFLPVIGYSQTEGFYVKAKIGFAPSDDYYGYYRVDAYTKLGLGLGYVAFFRRKSGRRAVDVNFYRFKSKQDGSQQNNFALNDSEIFSQRLRGQFGVNYQGNYGPFLSLPPSYTLNAAVSHTGLRESQSYTFNRNSTGSTQSSANVGFVDQRTLSPAVSQSENISFSQNSNAFAGQASIVSTLHLNTLTHVSSRGLDYDLTFDRTNSVTPFGIDKLPELMIRPHGTLDPNFRALPITGTFAVGDYTEPQSQLSTQRGEALLTFGPTIAHVLNSDLNASVIVRQDAYGTGDLKGQIQQNASFTTPLGRHIVNAITYSEQNSNGPQAEPFQSLDVYGGGSKQASDVIRFFNSDIYALSLQTNTLFNRTAQPVSYQLSVRPSPRSAVNLGGSWLPGAGRGFYTTNAQIVTPFGRGSDLQFSTNIDWKKKGRLESKNIYYRRVIGDCYEILAAYNQDLKQVTLTIEILAFPSHSASFGLQNQTSIIPGSLNFSNQ